MSLELNKAAAAVLTAGLVAMGSGFVADLLTQKHGLEENAYPIAVEGGMGHGGEAPEKPALESVLPLMASADAGKGEGEFRACAACHNIADGAGHKVGPNLWAVVGREKNGTDFANYSGALPDGSWGYAELNAFLANPKDYAPGTSMGFGGIDDVEDRANLIAYLRAQGSSDYPLPSEDEIAAATAAAEEEMAEEAPAEEMAAEESAEASAEAEAAAEESAAAEETATEEAAAEESAPAAAEGPVAMIAAADPSAGEAVFAQCGACHVKAAGANATVGPNLWNVVGRDIAGAEGFTRYSAAFESYGEGEQWTFEKLWEFLEAPMQVVPGTMMAYPGVKDEGDRAALIHYLNTLSDSPLPIE